MNIKKAQDVAYILDEIKWLKGAIDRLNTTGIHNVKELIYRKEAIKSLREVMKVRVEQLKEM